MRGIAATDITTGNCGSLLEPFCISLSYQQDIPTFDEAIKILQSAYSSEISSKNKLIEDLKAEILSKNDCIRELEENDTPLNSDEPDIANFFSTPNSQSKRRKLLSLNNRLTRDGHTGAPERTPSQNEGNLTKDRITRKKLSPNHSDNNLSSSSPALKYSEVVRNKDQRKKMHGNDCSCCKKFYEVTGSLPIPDELGLPSNQTTTMEQRLNRVSRHRYVYKPPDTPTDFWDVDFPSTQAIEKARKSSSRKLK
ncbi:hypothetical protein K493DRAFT_410237 [Basidiobolus meristosporus CBS 931.73]|uniref:DNA endonuclease activator Ctp1 C-terminal domain-containing protein n=1 Tax=Basidiobolus meristosporus CBS 931.73 TaxID=1314790 RepID=A0A1Y1XVK7_9FUNG|nr:hypothetical protein K493DRAFT_410237 [Basidiobolus meristosporus CBS 931.73]|eukprot:ORX89790.1 hypothetical protein K493DRAFT_410237 [Basidiobolus meristosporus CBS 931.73]